jgi:hypothetical protein
LHSGDILHQLHVIQRSSKIGSRNSADDSSAFVAGDIGLIAANDSVQASAAIGIAEIRMRQSGPDDLIPRHVASVCAYCPDGSASTEILMHS